MKTQIVVSSYAGAAPVFDALKPYWLAHKSPILVGSPENDKHLTEFENVYLEASSHHGPSSTRRMRRLFKLLGEREWDNCIIFEYDSFFLKPFTQIHRGFHAILFENQESPKYMAPRYGLPPWSFDRLSFDKMLQVMNDFPSIYENGYDDRFICALAFLANIPVLSYDPPGYASDTLKPHHLDDLKKHVQSGTTAIHGVKQEWMLRAIESFLPLQGS